MKITELIKELKRLKKQHGIDNINFECDRKIYSDIVNFGINKEKGIITAYPCNKKEADY